jgi:hypothetical protein
MKKFIKPSLLILILVMIHIITYAQPFDDDVNDVPLDGGLSLLIAGGVGYGIKKANNARNRKKEKDQKEL